MFPNLHSVVLGALLCTTRSHAATCPSQPSPPLPTPVLPAPSCVNQAPGPTHVAFPNGVTFKWIPATTSQPACDVLVAAMTRYSDIINNDRGSSWRRTALENNSILPAVTVVEIHIAELEPSPKPTPSMNESYSLQIGTPSNTSVILTAPTVWGALRGMETLSQLISTDPTGQLVSPTVSITDEPRFAYRGLMVDPARRFLPLSALEAVIDSMAYTKLNVLHMHMTDDQSWPLVLKTFPSLSEKGAFSQNHTYSQQDMSGLIEFARLRGVRVLIEIDMPGHSSIVALGYSMVTTYCPGIAPYGLNYSNLDPTKNSTYEYIESLLTEVLETFTDEYLFIGGDEVSTGCWSSNPDIRSWLAIKNLTVADLQPYFESALIGIAKKQGKQVIAWQEVFQTAKDPVGTLGKDAVIDVWKGGWQETMAQVTASGLRAVLSNCWYLDIIDGDTAWGRQWIDYYSCDPTQFDGTEEQKSLVMGGHGCIWGEACDVTNILPRIWPRLAAVAEKLWSPADFTQGVVNGTIEGGWVDVGTRMHLHRCRLLHRGIAASPVGTLGDKGIPSTLEIGPGSETYCPDDNRFEYRAPYT